MVSGLQTNRRGEGWRIKMLVPEDAEPKGPHPGFAHLLPFASLTGEGDNLTKLLPLPSQASLGSLPLPQVER